MRAVTRMVFHTGGRWDGLWLEEKGSWKIRRGFIWGEEKMGISLRVCSWTLLGSELESVLNVFYRFIFMGEKYVGSCCKVWKVCLDPRTLVL